MQPFSFKDILLKLTLKTYLGVLIATSLVYLLLDLIPIYKLFPNVEFRIVQVLWQTLLWTLYSICIGFFICHSLGSAFGIISNSFGDFFAKNFVEFLTAKFRVLIKSTLWGLLFFIPGFVMAIRYSLNEMVIFFNPGFLEDRTQDPLIISTQKISFFSPVLFILIVLYFILPAVLDSSFDQAHFQYEPLQRLAQILLNSVLILGTYIYLFKIYFNPKETI